MKKFCCFLFMISFATAIYSQEQNKNKQLSQEDYLKKSRNQKKTAWILLGGGAGLVVIGAAIPKGDYKGGSICLSGVCDDYENDGIKSALVVTGIVSMLGSIPFFGWSSANKRRAMRVTIKNEKTSVLYQNTIGTSSIPAISFRVTL
ncbi:MAG TPA: hypothetical protein VGD17_07555 [Chitinophagaceae bacterium]